VIKWISFPRERVYRPILRNGCLFIRLLHSNRILVRFEVSAQQRVHTSQYITSDNISERALFWIPHKTFAGKHFKHYPYIDKISRQNFLNKENGRIILRKTGKYLNWLRNRTTNLKYSNVVSICSFLFTI
jgi:hypothetical protein